jgi:hypothetical protein
MGDSGVKRIAENCRELQMLGEKRREEKRSEAIEGQKRSGHWG